MASVSLEVPLPGGGTHEQRMAVEELRKALAPVVGDPMVDFGNDSASLWIGGDDADQLLEQIKGSLEGVQIPPGTTALVQGEGDSKRVELS
jgi:hypothetical protein